MLVDTLSIDTGTAIDFPAHKLWLGAGKWAVECVANLGKIPPSGATVFVGAPNQSALPSCIQSGTMPKRSSMIAWLPSCNRTLGSIHGAS